MIWGKAHTIFELQFSSFAKGGKAPSATLAHSGWVKSFGHYAN